MKLSFIILSLVIVVLTSGMNGGCGEAIKDSTTPALKTLAEKRGIRFGAMYQSVFRGDLYDQIFETEMNTLVAGIFWGDGSRPSRTEFNFSEMDDKVNWGRARGMELHGHTLVWFAPGEMPNWLKSAPPTEVEAIMNEHIDAVVGRYAGKIKLWDVVNEAVNDGDTGTLRHGHTWFDAMGNDYIRKAYVRARAADSNAILRYNDYGMEDNKAKFDGVKALLIDLKKKGAPVQALGWQMHLKPGSFDPATLLSRMNEIADLGFDNYVTELDVELSENPSAADYELQKQTIKTAVETVLKARRLKSIVVWGIRDGDPDWLTKNHPQLFDENLNKKLSYYGVQEALKGN
jgi:endo-1,4-beta-xylanase